MRISDRLWSLDALKGQPMKEKSFEGPTDVEAKQRAEDWIRSQRGIRVTDMCFIGTGGGGGKKWEKISSPDRWTVIVKYEDGSN
jgi:hypothetical protein